MHLGLGPFAINAARYEAVDFTWPVSFVTVKVFAGRGNFEVDPWSFLLSFTPRVWTALLTSFLLLSVAFSFLSTKFTQENLGSREDSATKSLYFISIMLRQCEYFNTCNYVLLYFYISITDKVFVSRAVMNSIPQVVDEPHLSLIPDHSIYSNIPSLL